MPKNVEIAKICDGIHSAYCQIVIHCSQNTVFRIPLTLTDLKHNDVRYDRLCTMHMLFYIF